MQLYRAREWNRWEKTTGGLSGTGGLFVPLGLGGTGDCADVIRTGPFDVPSDVGQNVLHDGVCSTEPIPTLFVL